MTNNKPILNIKATDKVTHSRRIAIGSLIEVFKAHSGAPEQATVLWPGSGMVPPFDAREVEIIWTDDEDTEKTLGIPTETTYGGHPEEWTKPPVGPVQLITRPVATGEVQVGDLVTVRDFETLEWSRAVTLITKIDFGFAHPFTDSRGANWCFARHLTDEERAQIKRI